MGKNSFLIYLCLKIEFYEWIHVINNPVHKGRWYIAILLKINKYSSFVNSDRNSVDKWMN